jgi:hypothetical protein
MGRISKLGPYAGSALLLVFTLLASGCGSSGSSSSGPPTVTVTITPNPTASVNLGSTLQFNATVTVNRAVITTPIKFTSTNSAVLSIAPSGLACAGSWDKSFIVCSPGAPGVVTVRAVGFGTASPKTTVYVHPQATNITAAALNPPSASCVSQGQTENFQATVFSGTTDITPFVGPLTWTVMDPSVAKTSTTVAGLQSNQVQVTADQPGRTQIFASTSNLNGQNASFETCPVQSVSVVAASTGTDSLSLQSGSSQLVPTVTDTQGKALSVTGLTWVSSQPGVATTKSGSVTAVSPGGAAIFPVCSLPKCNVNLYPVYSANVVSTTVTGTVPAETVFVASSACYGVANCKTSLIPINTQTNTAGTAISLPAPPNSFLVDSTGANAYFETTAGLQAFAIATQKFQSSNAVVGKVLAVSPDGTQVIVSNTSGNPPVVYVVNAKAGTSTPLLVSGVTTAVFSPDSSTAYLLSGTAVSVYSTTKPLQTINLAGATDAAFLTTGTFGFVGSTPSTVSLFNGCDDASPASPNTPSVNTLSTPSLLAPLPDGQTMAAVTSPGFTTIAANTSAAGCPPPVSATPAFHDFGQGGFTPKQILVSSDGKRLYVIGSLPEVLLWDFTSATAGVIPLNPSATPLRAALTLSGHDLYVGASDGTVHHLDTVGLHDQGQIPVTLCSNTTATCLPDLVALRP